MPIRTVFLSSTVRDLADYRVAAYQAIQGLQGYHCVRMEDFGAVDWQADDFCRTKVADCDVFIAILGHLYGDCPPGSDQSYTEREYDAAIATNVPRLMFLAPEKFPVPANTIESDAARQKQAAFRRRVSTERVRDTFTSPEDLIGRVRQAIHSWERQNKEESQLAVTTERWPAPAASVPTKAHEWQPAVLCPLQPAPHFVGRDKLLSELTQWAKDPAHSARVLAVVAPGGTGKTALAERLLTDLTPYTAAGMLVWSFYEDPRTEAFLRTACSYFTGVEPKETGGLLERLQQGLTTAAPHLLILDGLERLQSEGHTGRPRGELEDPLMRRFLRWVAAGLGPRTKCLITSRFPLPDLVDWKAERFREHALDDLDAPAARAVLHWRGVKGTDSSLDALADGVHRHALTVDVLGSYLGTFHHGDATKAPSFDPQFLADTDPKSAKLHRVLGQFAEKLSPSEQDLLARLSVFPRGVGVDILSHIADSDRKVAGALVRHTELELLKLLERLQALGLVFRYRTGEIPTYTAHPFLRDFFERRFGMTKSKEIYEVARRKLAPSLKSRPDKHPTDTVHLDRYERLIELTRLAGFSKRAFDLYWHALGGFRHLGWVLGEYARGLRILSTFSKRGDPASAAGELSIHARDYLVNNWGQYAIALGDLFTARQAFETCHALRINLMDGRKLSRSYQNLALIELLAGRWATSLELAKTALERAHAVSDAETICTSTFAVAQALGRTGQVEDAQRYYAQAAQMKSDLQIQLIWEAEFRIITGDLSGARLTTEVNQAAVRLNGWTRNEAICDTFLGHCCLPNNLAQAHTHLLAARHYASRSGNIEVALRCYHLAAEVARRKKDFGLAVAEAEAGIQLADSSGFGRWALDLRAELARIHIAAYRPSDAIPLAEWVLTRSHEPEYQYAWGIADGLHLLGIAYARLNDKSKACSFLHRAIERRLSLNHPGLQETREELDRLGD